MSKLYIITGPAGVGKSTISKKIAESKKKSALIEEDDILDTSNITVNETVDIIEKDNRFIL